MVNAIQTGELKVQEQFTTTDAYINCLQNGIEEGDTPDAGDDSQPATIDQSDSSVQVPKDCVQRDARQLEDWDRADLFHGDEIDAAECGFSGDGWQGSRIHIGNHNSYR